MAIYLSWGDFMRKVLERGISKLYFCNQEEYEDFILKPNNNRTSFLLCAKNPFHKDIVGYDKNCPKDHPEYFYASRPEQHLMALNMIDAPDPKFFNDNMIDDALKFIYDFFTLGNDIIVVCNQGESRSPTMCLMYLMKYGYISKEKTWGEVAYEYSKIAPEWNPGAGIGEYCKRFWEKIRNGQ